MTEREREEELREYQQQIAAELQRSPDYRVLRRFVPRQSYENAENWTDAERHAEKVGLFVDCETTGLDPESDEMIQVAIQPFLFDNEPEGAERVVKLLPGYVGYEQPSKPIDKTIAARSHGITDEMVQGARFDVEAVRRAFWNAAIVLAHKADFDRPRFERRFPSMGIDSLPWACSLNEVDWTHHYGATANSLGAVLAAVGEFSDDSHDALEDCRIGIHVLASATREVPLSLDEIPGHALNDGATDAVRIVTAFNDLLRSARVPTIRLWAAFPFNEPVAARLKVRKYRWNDGKNGKPKAWFRDVKPDDVATERAWLLEVWSQIEITFTKFNARDRYSRRV